jgi:hypothetical protein
MKKHTATKAHTSLDHHAITTVLGTEVVADDRGQHRQNTTKAQGMEEPEGPEPLLGQYDYEDDEKEMGASCFTHRVRTTPVPKGFKLPHDQQKYNESQEP